ncbi:F-box-like domain protein, putative, partial [Rhizoctonia solani AG-3 Rhs1AP]
MQTLHSARAKLDSALDEYTNVCAALTNSRPIPSLNYSQSLRDEMDAGIELLTTFEKRTAQIKYTLNKAINSLVVPANSLPDEILSRIFHFTINLQFSSFEEFVDSGELSTNSLAISQVCTRWRQVAFGSKSLWTHIDLAACNGLFPLAQLFAARSGDLPLSVRAVERIDLPNQWNNFLLNELFEAVGHRLETIDLNLGQSLLFPNIRFSTLRSLVHCTPGKLTQLVLSDRKIFMDTHISDKYLKASEHWFIIHNEFRLPRMTGRDDYMNRYSYPVQLDISQERLEEILYHVKILKLDQIYPLWTSKAYHGLTELRLTGPRMLTAAIGEQQFANILTASPKLRVLHFGLEISLEETPPAPVRLEDLEVFLLQSFSFDTQQAVLRLILPGTKRLEMSTTYNEYLVELPAPIEEEYCRFFKRSNIVQLHVHSEPLLVHLVQLLALLPNLEVLILNQVSIQELNLPEHVSTPLCPNLRSIYCMSGSIRMNAIRWIVGTHNLEKVVIWNSRVLGANGDDERECKDLLADISPPVQILEYEGHPEPFRVEGWGWDMEDRMVISAETAYVVR